MSTPIPDYVQILRDRKSAAKAVRDADYAAIKELEAPYKQYGDYSERLNRYTKARGEFRAALRRVTSPKFGYDQEDLEKLGHALVTFEARRAEAGPFILEGYTSPRYKWNGEDPNGTDFALGKSRYDGEVDPTPEELAAFDDLLDAAREAVTGS